MSEASFHRVISDHLALSERNRRLERRMPLDRYRDEREAPKDEPETTMVGAGEEHWLDPDSAWDTTRERPVPEFDWGDN
ncbi:MAG: hypothetical protein ACRDL7_09630 [Gaiellaceae bacterium]